MSIKIDKKVAPFFGAWDSYVGKIVRAANKFIRLREISQKLSPELSPNRFPCLDVVDECFNAVIKPLLVEFFEKYPLINLGRGESQAVELYNAYIKDYCIGLEDKQALPPRIRINYYTIQAKHSERPRPFARMLESEKDIWETLSTRYPDTRDIDMFLGSLDEHGLIHLRLALMAFQLERASSLPVTLDIKEFLQLTIPEIKELLLPLFNGHDPRWDKIKDIFSPSHFLGEVMNEHRICKNGVLAIVDWKNSVKEKSSIEAQPQPVQGEEKVKETPQKKVISYLDSLVVRLVGLLAAVVTLIMFVYWLSAKQ